MNVVEKTKEFVKGEMKGDAAHDWEHVFRVYRNAVRIAEKEGGNIEIVALASLLHDVADWKYSDEGSSVARKWMEKCNVDRRIIEEVCEIIDNMSFKGVKAEQKKMSKEGEIVQDADRLDAIGAIAVARCFAYGGMKGRKLYDPDIKYSFDHYEEKAKGTWPTTSLNHFYEKLLLLKDKLNTETARKMAERKHNFMQMYVDEFLREWNLEDL